MFATKIEALKAEFAGCATDQSRYEKIIQLGRSAKPLDAIHKIPENLVSGCQSRMYLHTALIDDKLYFHSEADALISNGLGILLTTIYSGEHPETVLKASPTFLEELRIPSSLSPSRANGLASLFLRMKQEALQRLSLVD